MFQLVDNMIIWLDYNQSLMSIEYLGYKWALSSQIMINSGMLYIRGFALQDLFNQEISSIWDEWTKNWQRQAAENAMHSLRMIQE